MDDLMDMLVKDDESASQISDKIKDILFAKSAEQIETIRPNVAASIFDDGVSDEEIESEVEVEPSGEE
tara:strand:- start:1417 stop:1620 length:204 start_codon:yes stop_codon:yes gene_type:complete